MCSANGIALQPEIGGCWQTPEAPSMIEAKVECFNEIQKGEGPTSLRTG